MNLTDDAGTLRGVLWSQRGPWLTFKQCAVLKPNVMAIDGDVVIHRSKVLFMQVPP